MNKNKNILYIFLHIPKTGGNSFRFHLKKKIKNNKLIFLYKNTNSTFETQGGIKNYITSLADNEKNKIKVIIGHEVYYGIHQLFKNRECRYVTFFRDPVKLVVSYYNFAKTHLATGKIKNWDENFENFCEQKYSKNIIYKSLTEKGFATLPKNFDGQIDYVIKQALAKFYFIGITKKATPDFSFLCHKLGIGELMPKFNVSKKYIKPKKVLEMKKIILANNKYDYSFYQAALKRNESFKGNNNFFKTIKKLKIKNIAIRPQHFFLEQAKRFSLHLRIKSKIYRNLINYISD